MLCKKKTRGSLHMKQVALVSLSKASPLQWRAELELLLVGPFPACTNEVSYLY